MCQEENSLEVFIFVSAFPADYKHFHNILHNLPSVSCNYIEFRTNTKIFHCFALITESLTYHLTADDSSAVLALPSVDL
jgi:hypothetical protein